MMSVPFLSLRDVTAKYRDEIHQAALRVIDSGWYLQGDEVARFEQHYAAYVGADHCVGCANGLDALIWIFRACIELGYMQPGDEVIVPANTYIATLLGITENGLVPILCEPKASTLQIDDSRIEALITPRTRAICIVHLYGRNAYTPHIGALCLKHHLRLIEDCAQSHGLQTTQRPAGLQRYCAHSFYPGKNLGALGDGGAVTTTDAPLAQAVRTLANYGSQQKYVFQYTGRNSRLDEIQAAILDVKLQHLDQDVKLRQQVAAYYYDHISHPLITLPERLPDTHNVYHLFPILSTHRTSLQQYLTANGIGTVIHYPIPPHLQECYTHAPWNQHQTLPITEQLATQELSLPMSPCLTPAQLQYVVTTLNRFRP